LISQRLARGWIENPPKAGKGYYKISFTWKHNGMKDWIQCRTESSTLWERMTHNALTKSGSFALADDFEEAMKEHVIDVVVVDEFYKPVEK